MGAMHTNHEMLRNNAGFDGQGTSAYTKGGMSPNGTTKNAPLKLSGGVHLNQVERLGLRFVFVDSRFVWWR